LGLVWGGRWDDGERYLDGLVGIHGGDGVHWRLGLGKGEIRCRSLSRLTHGGGDWISISN
jgi:hypothetical protein